MALNNKTCKICSKSKEMFALYLQEYDAPICPECFNQMFGGYAHNLKEQAEVIIANIGVGQFMSQYHNFIKEAEKKKEKGKEDNPTNNNQANGNNFIQTS